MDRRLLDDAMKDHGISLRDLARRLDMLPSQLSLTFSGKRRMQFGEAVAISQILSIPLTTVAVAAGIKGASLSERKVSVVGWMDSDGVVRPPDGIERAVAPLDLPEDIEAIQARTAGGALEWMDGFVMFAPPLSDAGAVLGRFCRCKLENGTEVVGTLRRGYTSGTYSIAGPANLESQRIIAASEILLTRN